MNTRLSYFLILLLTVLSCQLAAGEDNRQLQQCPLVKVDVERLPDLNVPRNSHSAACLNGEVTVFGGHTTNFISTPTAEYLKDGQWHLIEMAYPHDNGLCVVLRSGRVLLAGGHAEPMGVGQSYNVEEYNPDTHSFRGFCIMDMKRTFASGAELDSGRVVVSGNWYAGDGLEMFDGDRHFSYVKDVTTPRAVPYMLRTSDGDVLILGNESSYGQPLCSDRVDRLKGDPLRVPLLNKWQPVAMSAPFPNDLSFIGDERKGDTSYLLAVQDWRVDTTQWTPFCRKMALMLVSDTTFTLLPTACPVPMTGFSASDSILWRSPLIADRKAHRGYVNGCDLQGRNYVLCVEYDKRPAPLTLYYTDPLPDAGYPMIVLTDEGNLIIVGGHNYNKKLGGQLDSDNFSPLASVYLLHVSGDDVAKAPKGASARWLWMILGLVVLTIAVAVIWMVRRRHRQVSVKVDDLNASAPDPNQVLMQRIRELMEERQLYLDANLKLSDLATQLGTNRNIVSACINSQYGFSFNQLLNEYRIRHAQTLMQRKPDLKILEVWTQSGFSTETSFFRAFKIVTGTTPNKWKNR